MLASKVEELFRAVLPFDLIQEQSRSMGVQARQQAFDPPPFVLSLVLYGGTAEAGRIATSMREHCIRVGESGARSDGHRCFDEELLALLTVLIARAKAHLEEVPRSLPGVLAGRTDWRAIDRTKVKLCATLADTFPGTGKNASIRVHTEVSLGIENVVDWHITPAKRNDRPELVVDERRAGTGLLVDVGYVSHDFIRRCHEHDVQFVVRLKRGWKAVLGDDAYVEHIVDEDVPAAVLREAGEALPDELDAPLDVDLRLGNTPESPGARLVNVKTPSGWHAYLTNVPRSSHDASALSFLYSLRSGVELQNKLAKSGCELDEIDAEDPVSVQILVHASMLAALIANALAHAEHVDQGYIDQRVVRPTGKRPPVHATNIWKAVPLATSRISDLLSQPPAAQGWQRLAKYVAWAGKDPNWRKRPSSIDDAKGRNAAGRALRARRKSRSRSRSA